MNDLQKRHFALLPRNSGQAQEHDAVALARTEHVGRVLASLHTRPCGAAAVQLSASFPSAFSFFLPV